MKKLLVLSFLTIQGCASAVQTYAPDGRDAYSLNCSGTARNWGMCYEKAGEICLAQGYDIINQSGEQGVYATAYTTTMNASSLHFRTMTIACKT